MSQVKLSISLSEHEVAALDKYAHAAGLKSRSAAIQQAIRLLGDTELQLAYESAWQEWSDSDDADARESATADGMADASR